MYKTGKQVLSKNWCNSGYLDPNWVGLVEMEFLLSKVETDCLLVEMEFLVAKGDTECPLRNVEMEYLLSN